MWQTKTIVEEKLSVKECTYLKASMPMPINLQFYLAKEAKWVICFGGYGWYLTWVQNIKNALRNCYQSKCFDELINPLKKVVPNSLALMECELGLALGHHHKNLNLDNCIIHESFSFDKKKVISFGRTI